MNSWWVTKESDLKAVQLYGGVIPALGWFDEPICISGL
jgi:hypothetical protein